MIIYVIWEWYRGLFAPVIKHLKNCGKIEIKINSNDFKKKTTCKKAGGFYANGKPLTAKAFKKVNGLKMVSCNWLW